MSPLPPGLISGRAEPEWLPAEAQLFPSVEPRFPCSPADVAGRPSLLNSYPLAPSLPEMCQKPFRHSHVTPHTASPAATVALPHPGRSGRGAGGCRRVTWRLPSLHPAVAKVSHRWWPPLPLPGRTASPGLLLLLSVCVRGREGPSSALWAPQPSTGEAVAPDPPMPATPSPACSQARLQTNTGLSTSPPPRGRKQARLGSQHSSWQPSPLPRPHSAVTRATHRARASVRSGSLCSPPGLGPQTALPAPVPASLAPSGVVLSSDLGPRY